MKKTILTNLKFMSLGLMLALFASYAHATWGGLNGLYSGPSASFPGSNTAFPINVGTLDQVKDGGLSLGGPFIAAANAQIDGSAIFHGVIRGGLPGDPTSSQTVSFGGNGAGVHLAVNGGLGNTNYRVQSVQLSNTANGAICANEIGVLVLCDVDSTAPYIPPDPTSPPAPRPVPATGQVRISINPDSQNGTSVNIYNTETRVGYTITMPSGQRTGYSSYFTVPAGVYKVNGWDLVCNDYGDPREMTPIPITTYIGEGDTFTISFSGYHCQ